jgi:hypothetical protein
MLVVALIGLLLAVLIPREQRKATAPPSAPSPAEAPAPETQGGQVA